MGKLAEFKLENLDEVLEQTDQIIEGIVKRAREGLEKAAKNTAEDIKVIFKGGSNPGFQDRTGALRASIAGGLVDTGSEESMIGFVGAGDDSIGSHGQTTRSYVELIEFGEFRHAGHTSFLRLGLMTSKPQIDRIMEESLDLETLI